jgi:hypothetical protein
MYKRAISRVATVATVLLLTVPAVAMANQGGQSHSTNACPAHEHSGKHNGSSKGKKKGTGKGKQCGTSTS